MAYDHMDLTEGEELYADEFGERIQSDTGDDYTDEELIVDESAEDDMAPMSTSTDQADTFGERLSTADAPEGSSPDATEPASDSPASDDGARDEQRETWAG
jgi:hypothetical protein